MEQTFLTGLGGRSPEFGGDTAERALVASIAAFAALPNEPKVTALARDSTPSVKIYEYCTEAS